MRSYTRRNARRFVVGESGRDVTYTRPQRRRGVGTQRGRGGSELRCRAQVWGDLRSNNIREPRARTIDRAIESKVRRSVYERGDGVGKIWVDAAMRGPIVARDCQA